MEDLSKIWPVSDVPSYAISIYEGPDTFLLEYEDAPEIERVLLSAYWLQAEVLNGGLAQFFSNDTGVLAPEAVEACRTLGLVELAAKVLEAMAWFGESYPRVREIRQEALMAFANSHTEGVTPFDELDEVVAGLIYNERNGLENAALALIKSHGS
jgi:Domain of unknown function (DUF4375)